MACAQAGASATATRASTVAEHDRGPGPPPPGSSKGGIRITEADGETHLLIPGRLERERAVVAQSKRFHKQK